MSPEFIIAISLIFGGCCSNVITLELLTNAARSSGPLMLLSQFAFQSIISFPHVYAPTWPIPLRPRVVPLTRWSIMVLLFFLNNYLNALALACNVSMPLHIIFRSGGLLGALVVGHTFGNKRYSFQQVASVVIVTLGIIMTTISDAVQHQKDTASSFWWMVGVSSLLACVFIASFLGLYQEWTYATYGKQWKEAMFYMHLMSMPLLLFYHKELVQQVQLFNASPQVSLSHVLPPGANVILQPLIPFYKLIVTQNIPVLWVYLLLNVFSQYVCISGVMRFSTITSSLTLNLVLSLRKLASLILSVWWFNNHLGWIGVAGVVLVGIGTVLYINSQPAKFNPQRKQD